MPTTNLYTKMQSLLHPFRNVFLGLMLLLIFLAIFVIGSFESGPVPPEKVIWMKIFIIALCAAGALGWLHGVSTYQKKSRFRQLPYVGKAIKIFFGPSTAKSEAIHLNIIFLILFLQNIVAVFMVLST